MYRFYLDEHFGAAWEGILRKIPPFAGTVVRSELQQHELGSLGTYGCRHFLTVKAWLRFRSTRRGLLSKDLNLGVECNWMNCSELVRLPVSHPNRSTISAAPLASQSSMMEVIEDLGEEGERLPPSLNAVQRHYACNGDNEAVDSIQLKGGHRESIPPKRRFCKRCDKAAVLCICHHVKTVVKNRTSIVILQHPEEKRHFLGTARIAHLALQNVEIISIPEVDEKYSIRMREKVPGSKRSIAGRGGKKAQNVREELEKKELLPNCLEIQPAASNSHYEQQPGSQYSPNVTSEEAPIREEKTTTRSIKHQQLVQWSRVPPWANLQPDVGLLFPSEKALDLMPPCLGLTSNAEFALPSQCTGKNVFVDENGKGVPSNSPSQLIVLDGTWKKAKRVFFENPWLHSLPHYRLPTVRESRYGSLRPEPKLGFLSTVESIVYALQLLEPETQGLESLLDVFDAMIEDQVRLFEERGKARS